MNGKNIAISSISAAVVGVTSILLLDKKSRRKMKTLSGQVISKLKRNKETEPIRKEIADPNDEKQAKMVSEGSLYAIQRYNEQQQQKTS